MEGEEESCMGSLGTVIRRILGECSTPAGPAGTFVEDEEVDEDEVADVDVDEGIEAKEWGREGTEDEPIEVDEEAAPVLVEVGKVEMLVDEDVLPLRNGADEGPVCEALLDRPASIDVAGGLDAWSWVPTSFRCEAKCCGPFPTAIPSPCGSAWAG